MNKILIVDDDEMIQMLYADELDEEGYNVFTIGDCTEVMAMIQEKSSELTEEQYEHYSDQFPIFDDAGKKSVEGNIVCTTCHDVHIWDPHHPQKGTGEEEEEGDATNSFLRKDISFTFCASCHGEEALYKFKYFHDFKGRKQ